jgi:excisionase family DNA binding protein
VSSRPKFRRYSDHPASAEPFWTPTQIGRRWQVSARTVRRLIEAGELPASRMGMQMRVKHADLLAYENGQAINPESEDPTKEDQDAREGNL